MADQKYTEAKNVLSVICAALDELGLDYRTSEDEEFLVVMCGIYGREMPVEIGFFVDIERQIIRLASMLPFDMGEDKRVEGAVAAIVISRMLVDGNFAYDFDSGKTSFSMTACYEGSKISTELIKYMIECGYSTVDEMNGRLLALSKGTVDMIGFLDSLAQ